MVKPHAFWVVGLSVAIGVSASLLSLQAGVQACPSSDRASSSLFRPSDAPDDLPGEVGRPSDLRRQFAVGAMEFAGFGAIVGLFAIAILYQLRQQDELSTDAASLGNRLGLEHPRLEHPELVWTAVPKEALPLAALNPEIVLLR